MSATTIDLVLEALRKQSPLTLTELAEYTGIKSNQISAAISKAGPEGQPVHRVGRGQYAYGVEGSEPLESDAQVSVARESESTLSAGARAMHALRDFVNVLPVALGELEHYVAKLEAKAEAYDRVRLAVNGEDAS